MNYNNKETEKHQLQRFSINYNSLAYYKALQEKQAREKRIQENKKESVK